MKLKIFYILALLFIFFKCAVQPPIERPSAPVSKKIPLVRVGLAENINQLEFTSNGKIEIFDRDKIVASSVNWDQKWQVQIRNTRPSKIVYRLRHKEIFDQRVAERIIESLTAQNLPVFLEKIKKRIFHNNSIELTDVYFVFLGGDFDSEPAAYNFSLNYSDQIKTVAVQFIKTPPLGEIILNDIGSGKQYSSSRFLKISGDLFTIKLPTSEGFHYEEVLERKYRSQVEFFIDRFGKLTVVNALPLENYLMGVVGSEMQEKFPLEALKAQAVTARSYSIARIGKQHPLSPFDLCDEVHCHVYGGVDRESPQVSKAVEKTRGMVLMYDEKICDTFYAGVCGGYSENNEFVWDGEPQVYLQGRLDADIDGMPEDFLKDESNVRQWIESSPNVFCNTQNEDTPAYLNYTKKYFRWQVKYSQAELSQIIQKKTGQDIGTLLEIIPIVRGVSGRLIQINLTGTRKTISVEKELEIRKALSENYLYSSCFVVDREGNDFILKGAGWGHGVGMCQTGAAQMALKKFDFRKILNHYYQNTTIVKLY